MTKMNPTLFLYLEKDNQFELYLGEFSTLDGLRTLDDKIQVRELKIGATSYKKYGWATVKEFPNWKTVKEIKGFLQQEGEFGLSQFEIELIGVGSFSSHDDGECNFKFEDRRELIKVLKNAVNPVHEGLVIAALLNNPGIYIAVEASGKLKKYASFDQYLKEKNF